MREAVLVTLLLSALLGCADDPITPAPAPFTIDSPGKVIEGLERAYRERSYSLFENLLANDPDRDAEYLFILSELTEEGDDQWGFSEEARIHRRMFRPQDTPDGEPPVPSDVWLETVDITLTPLSNFSERPDLYSEGGADGTLHPSVWRATSALYATNVFFRMVGETDFQVNGQADFIVLEDLAKTGGEDGRFVLLAWEDIPVNAAKSEGLVDDQKNTWTAVKDLYR